VDHVTRTVEFQAQDDAWFFAGERRLDDGAYSLVLKRRDLGGTTATDLARALRKSRRHEQEPESVVIDSAPDDEYSPKESVVDKISFLLRDDETLGVEVAFSGDRYTEDDKQLSNAIGQVLSPSSTGTTHV
jgi:hypothetical protein